jgi:light-regulated signal transduction histidine kinase (bacteriophytochrome)
VTQVLPGIEADPADWIGVYGRVALTGEEARFEQYSEPLHKWFSITAYSPKQRQFATVFKDITGRKNDEMALEAAVRELKRSNTELEQFAYVCAHDLQEPLRQVRAFVHLLRERYAAAFDGKAAQYFQFVSDGAARMSDLVRGLLEYSRVGGRDLPHRVTSSNQALDTALADLRVSIAEARAVITHDDLPTVTAEPTQLAQVFQNLIGNAVKFRRDGLDPQIHVGCRSEDGAWVFSVSDNGIGIAPEHRDKVFLIFQRLHDRQKYPGTGIGLAICKKIVEQHGGKIWTAAHAGAGSTLSFTLPKGRSA